GGAAGLRVQHRSREWAGDYLNLMRVMPPKEARPGHAIFRAWLFCFRQNQQNGQNDVRKLERRKFCRIGSFCRKTASEFEEDLRFGEAAFRYSRAVSGDN